MAKGRRAIGRFEAVLGVIGVLALVVTYALVTGWNPLPGLADWVTRARQLSDPPPAWHIEVGDQPTAAVVVDGTVVISARGSVGGYAAGTGDKIWSQTVPWSGVAGSSQTGGAVVIAGRPEHGYDAIDAGTGRTRWSDDTAIGVWTFTNLVIGIACQDALLCTLTARSPADGSVRWHAELTGNGRPLAGANKAVSGVGELADLPEPPGPVPPLLGFMMNDEVQVIATGSGRRLHTYQATQTTRVAVAGNRVIVVTVLWRDGTCRYSVDGRDPDGDHRVWHLDGYDLRTSSGLGCDQRRDPSGGQGLLAAVAPDNRDVLLDADTGAVAYRAPAGQTILATDGHVVLVRADAGTVQAVALLGGGTGWSRKAGRSTHVGFAPGVAVFSDPGHDRLGALATASGQVLLEATSGATVIGYAANGVIVNIGRQVGLVSYTAAAR